MLRFFVLVTVLAFPACLAQPAVRQTSGTGSLEGHVKLVRREGVKAPRKNDPVYADHRAESPELVDYRKPGFVVVYLEGAPSPGGLLTLAIAPRPDGRAAIQPDRAAVGVGGKIIVRNTDSVPHVVSAPGAGCIRRIEPGAEAVIEATHGGLWTVFALGGVEEPALVFAAPGPYTLAADDGRWSLIDLPPGQGRLCAWHPRFPAALREVNVVPGVVVTADLEVGVDNLSKELNHESETTR